MSPLVLAALRALVAAPGRALAVIALVAVALSVYAGTYLGLNRIASTTDTLYDDLRLYDLVAEIPPADETTLPDAASLVARIPSLAAATWRLDVPATLLLPIGESAAAAVQALPGDRRPDVSDALLTEGAWISDAHPDGVVIDRTFAADLNLHVGTPLTLRLRDQAQEVRVRGIAVFPEYLMGSVDEHFFMPVRRTLAVVLVPDARVRTIVGFVPRNRLLIQLRPDADRASAVAGLRAALGEDTTVRLRADQYSVWCNWNRLTGFRDFLPSVIAVFVGLSFLVLLTLVRRMAQGWRRELGAILAHGERPLVIWRAWSAAMVLLVAVGALLGTGGALLLARAVTYAYVEGTGFPILLADPGVGPLVQGWLLCLAIVGPAVALPLWPELRQWPATLLRPPVPSAASLPWMGRLRQLDAALGGLAAPERLGLRNVLRRPLMFLTTTTSLSGMLVTAVSMFLFADGLDGGMDEYLRAQRWDALVSPSDVLSPAEAEALSRRLGATDAEGFALTSATIEADGDSRSVDLVGLPVPSRLTTGGGLLSGHYPPTSDGDALTINLRTAQDLHLSPGDPVSVRVGGHASSMTVAGVVNNYVVNQAFVGADALARLAGGGTEPDSLRAAVLVNAPPTVIAGLASQDGVGRVLRRDQVVAAAYEVNGVLTGFLRLYGGLAAGVGALLAIVLLGIQVQDRTTEYATLRSLGFGSGALARMLGVEALVTIVAAAVAAIPSIWLVVRIFQARIAHISVDVAVVFDAPTLARMLAPALLVQFVALLPAWWQARKVDVARVLRERTGG